MNRPLAPSPVRTVLVISSDRANMQLMTQLIARRGDLKLLTANNGKNGMELAGACQPDVIVMDTWLSGISSRDALEWLCKNPETSQIPVVAVSSDALKTQVDAGLRAGFHRYLTKPFKVTDLMDAIDNSLGYTLYKLERFAGPGSRNNEAYR